MVAVQSRVVLDPEACKEATATERARPDVRWWPWAVGLVLLSLQLVSIAGVAWLTVRVVHLGAEVERLRSTGGPDMMSNGSGHTAGQLHDRTTDVHSSDKSRSRRQADNFDTDSDSPSYYGMNYGFGSEHGHPSLHVTGNQQPQLEAGNWFTFHTSSNPSNILMAHENLIFKHGKFIEVTIPGYYYVYSQMFYVPRSHADTGHKVVLQTDCGNGGRVTLLRAHSAQSRNAAGVTGYAGGVFYLNTRDRLGVQASRPDEVYHVNITDSSYFGAFLLSPNSNALDADTNTQCT